MCAKQHGSLDSSPLDHAQACRSSRDERCSHPPAFHGKAALRRMPRKKDRRPQTAAQDPRNPKSSHGRRQASPKWSLEGLPAAGKPAGCSSSAGPQERRRSPVSPLSEQVHVCNSNNSLDRGSAGATGGSVVVKLVIFAMPCHVLVGVCSTNPCLGMRGGCTQSSRGMSGKIDARSQGRLVVISHLRTRL